MSNRMIGVIGLGLLGSALADRLLESGYDVVGFDTSRDCRDRLQRVGGKPAESVAEVAAICTAATGDGGVSRILLSLPDSLVVRQVLDQLRPLLPSGAVIVDTTTGSPADAEVRATELAEQGIGYVDATVVGSSEQARAGQAVMLVGGDSPHIAAVQDLLQACAMRHDVVGPSGSGARLKLVVNLVLGLNRAALAEGLHLARACGLDLERTLEVLQATPAASCVMETKGLKMIREDFSPQARLAQHHKDVQLILDLARDAGTSLPLSDVHQRMLQRAMDQGCGLLDNSAIIRAWGGLRRES